MQRRSFLLATAAAALGARSREGTSASPVTDAKGGAARPVPSAPQLAWQRSELAMFLHFGINTFTDREWGDGQEDPRLFNPPRVDARQWVRTAKAGGCRLLVLTAKHHDGFCLWPSRHTAHSVRSSPWRNGEGDVVRELVEACREERLGVGLYLSPWDRHEPSYGDSERYNAFYRDQLTELLTRYGPIAEVWFDGANGEGPNGKRQEYDWPRIHRTVRVLQPNALIFSDAGPDIRWIGNEKGVAGDPNWCTVDPAAVPVPGLSGDAVTMALQHGHPRGTVWRPGEADVSIRPGWFWHASEDTRLRLTEDLKELYFTSVGRNSGLLLNVPPTNEGRLHDADVKRVAELGSWIGRMTGNDFAAGAVARAVGSHPHYPPVRVLDGDPDSYWSPPTGVTRAWIELDLRRAVLFDTISLREAIAHGQRVERYFVQCFVGSGWSLVARGTTIGNRKLDRFTPVRASRVRLTIESALDTPLISGIALYRRDG